MRGLFPDWRAPGLSVCLHERRGGFAFNRESMLGLASKARAAGAEIEEGVEVTGFELDDSGAVTRVETSAGPIAAEQVVVAVGPWVAAALGDARSCRGGSRSRGEEQRDVDLLVPPGGRDRRRPERVRDGRRQAAAGAPRGQPRAAPRRRRRADHRRAVGRLLQAGQAQRPGRRRAAAEGPRVRGGPLPHRQRRGGLPRPLVRRALALHGALRGRRGRSTARCAPAAWARSRPTTSRCSTTCARTCSWPPTRTTATR